MGLWVMIRSFIITSIHLECYIAICTGKCMQQVCFKWVRLEYSNSVWLTPLPQDGKQQEQEKHITKSSKKYITVPSKQSYVPPDISEVLQPWPKWEASKKVHFNDSPSNSGDDCQPETKVNSESDNDNMPEQNSESDMEVAKAQGHPK